MAKIKYEDLLDISLEDLREFLISKKFVNFPPKIKNYLLNVDNFARITKLIHLVVVDQFIKGKLS